METRRRRMDRRRAEAAQISTQTGRFVVVRAVVLHRLCLRSRRVPLTRARLDVLDEERGDVESFFSNDGDQPCD